MMISFTVVTEGLLVVPADNNLEILLEPLYERIIVPSHLMLIGPSERKIIRAIEGKEFCSPVTIRMVCV